MGGLLMASTHASILSSSLSLAQKGTSLYESTGGCVGYTDLPRGSSATIAEASAPIAALRPVLQEAQRLVPSRRLQMTWLPEF